MTNSYSKWMMVERAAAEVRQATNLLKIHIISTISPTSNEIIIICKNNNYSNSRKNNKKMSNNNNKRS